MARGEVQTLAQILRRAVNSSSTPGSSTVEIPDGYCDRCNEVHACQACHDSGRVRRQRPADVYQDAIEIDPRFGMTDLCRCVSGVKTSPEKAVIRMQIPELLRDKTLANWTPNNAPPRIAVQNWALAKPWPTDRFFLVLSGPPGRGKTHLAAAAMKSVWAAHEVAGRFVVVPELLRRIRATFDEETRTETAEQVIAEMLECRLLCLDDLGAEKASEWAAEQVFTIVNHRYTRQMPTIITTNIDAPNLAVDDRVFSRICSRETGVFVDIPGDKFPDRRLAS